MGRFGTTGSLGRRALAAAGLLLAAALLAGPAAGHFRLNVNVRILHVEHLDDGLRVFLRLPTPYLLAPLIGEEQADGSVAPAPYTTNRRVEGELLHYLDPAEIEQSPEGLGRLVADGHRIVHEGTPLPADIEAVRVYPAAEQPSFATLQEAKRAMESPPVAWPPEGAFVGDSVTDVALRYRAGMPVYAFSLASTLDPGLPEQERTANLILDHFAGETLVFRETGLLKEPIEISRSPLKAALGFVWEGVIHILEGTDHVLFVLCLTIGASRISALLWRVTGFTVGHTVTLILGFFGLVPQGAWFIPTVEAGIALSIVYAGAIALLNKEGAGTIAVTTALGLLHGLGFSFVLHEILDLDSPNLWQSLLSFNVGVELGQAAIVLLVWPLYWGLGRLAPSVAAARRWVVALPCIAVAALWTGERTLQAVSAL